MTSQRMTETVDTDQDRQQLIDELNAALGVDWSDQYKPGTFGCHELLDRTAFTADLVVSHIATHPACIRNPEWYALAQRAAHAMCELYQQIGAEHLEDNSGSGSGTSLPAAD